MYSIVLMAAMTTAPETASFGGSFYNHSTLDSCFPRRYGWVSCGPRYSYGCGGCYGYSACHGYAACHGCYGCYGFARSCHGCYGSGYGWWADPAGCAGYYGFGGAYGNYGFYGAIPMGTAPTVSSIMTGTNREMLPTSPSYLSPGSIMPTYPPSNESRPNIDGNLERKEMRPISGNSSSATIVLEVPNNAKVYIDGNLMKSTAERRVFRTPELEPNEEYYYAVKVVIEENGKVAEDTKTVYVKAGDQTERSFAYLKKSSPDFATVSKTNK